MYRFPWDGVSSQFGPEQTREKDEPWANSQRPKPLAVHSGAKPWVVKLNYDKFKCRSPGNIVVISKSRQKECKNYQSLKHMSIRQFCQCLLGIWAMVAKLPFEAGEACRFSKPPLDQKWSPFSPTRNFFICFSSSMRNLKNRSGERVLINFHFQPCVCIAVKRRHITLSHYLGFLFQP